MSGIPPWTCDTCGEPIDRVEDGWVEWLSRPMTGQGRESYALRLVHDRPSSPNRDRLPNGCQHNEKAAFAQDRSIVSDLQLEQFVGESGLMVLLGFLSDNKFSDNDEVLEMIKRIHIEGYEQARDSFDAAIHDGAFEPNTKPRFYSPSDIRAVLRWKERQHES